jgi:hypothetical protein
VGSEESARPGDPPVLVKSVYASDLPGWNTVGVLSGFPDRLFGLASVS